MIDFFGHLESAQQTLNTTLTLLPLDKVVHLIGMIFFLLEQLILSEANVQPEAYACTQYLNASFTEQTVKKAIGKAEMKNTVLMAMIGYLRSSWNDLLCFLFCIISLVSVSKILRFPQCGVNKLKVISQTSNKQLWMIMNIFNWPTSHEL